MRKILSLIILLSLLLFSCARSEPSVTELALSLCEELCPSGRVYLSGAEEGGEHYAPSLFSDMFEGSELLPREWALIFASSLDTTLEVGIFVASDGADSLALTELCEERIRLFSLLGKEEESFIVRRGRTVVYGVLPNADYAREYAIALLRA